MKNLKEYNENDRFKVKMAFWMGIIILQILLMLQMAQTYSLLNNECREYMEYSNKYWNYSEGDIVLNPKEFVQERLDEQSNFTNRLIKGEINISFEEND